MNRVSKYIISLGIFVLAIVFFSVDANAARTPKIINPSVYKNEDYSAVYNFDYYCNRYPDIMQRFKDNPQGAILHFINSGMREGRSGNDEFELISYKNKYEDLRSTFGTDNASYYLHYMRFGKAEGRICKGVYERVGTITSLYGIDYSPIYNYSYYLSKYPDVAASCGGDDVAVLSHFINVGMKEKRSGNKVFNIDWYMSAYPDLRELYGDDPAPYYLHFARSGNREGRLARKCTIREEEFTSADIYGEYDLVFVADSHVNLCDYRDSNLFWKADSRDILFRNANGKSSDDTFEDVMDTAREINPDLLILGGDIIDSAMYASIDFVRNELTYAGIPWAYSMGNHDFEYGNEYFSREAYETYLPRLDSIRTTRDGYQVVDMGEFTIFLVDDAGNKYSAESLYAFSNEVKKGKPIILVSHVPIEPLVDRDLLRVSKEFWGIDVLIGDDSNVPDTVTREFLELALGVDSPVIGILSGHLHFYHKDMITGKVTQISTGAGYQGDLLHIKVRGLY